MPSSFVWIGLVAVWLFVLVPMLVNKRPRIRQTSDAALATRVLHRGDSNPVQRGPAAGHRSDPNWQPEPVRSSYDAEDQMDTHAEDDYAGGRAPVGEFVPVRRGRGGFDPEADAIAREARYAFRQRTLLGLAFVAILSGALALIISPMVWWLFALTVCASAGTWRTCVAGSDRARDSPPSYRTPQPIATRSRIAHRRRASPDSGATASARSGCPRGRRRRSGVRSPGSLRRRDQAHRDASRVRSVIFWADLVGPKVRVG